MIQLLCQSYLERRKTNHPFMISNSAELLLRNSGGTRFTFYKNLNSSVSRGHEVHILVHKLNYSRKQIRVGYTYLEYWNSDWLSNVTKNVCVKACVRELNSWQYPLKLITTSFYLHQDTAEWQLSYLQACIFGKDNMNEMCWSMPWKVRPFLLRTTFFGSPWRPPP